MRHLNKTEIYFVSNAKILSCMSNKYTIVSFLKSRLRELRFYHTMNRFLF
jgi:hypothetical protein